MHRKPFAVPRPSPRTYLIILALLVPALALTWVIAFRTQRPDPARIDSDHALQPAVQELTWHDAQVNLSGTVALQEVGGSQDPAAMAALEQTVKDAGGTVAGAGQEGSATARIVVGTGDRAAGRMPGDLAPPAEPEGYALATSQDQVPTVSIVGTDAAGTFYGAQTLARLAAGSTRDPHGTPAGSVPGVRVRDWPDLAVRGVVEGFYGQPWSHQARLDVLASMASHKLNTYMYTPKDDVYLRERWRDPYPAEELAALGDLVRAAGAQHVEVVVALSPGADICYRSEEDYQATVAKLDQLRTVGVTRLSIALDDTPESLTCAADTAQADGQDDTVDLVSAQSAYLNRVQSEYVTARGLPDLIDVPTQYTGSQPTTAKDTQAQTLDPAVAVMWTGEGVVTEEITADQARSARESYGTSSLLIWDNFPTNDGSNVDRLFLAAPQGRDENLAEQVDGILTNPMIQAYASMPAIAAYGSLSWNASGYESSTVLDQELARLVGARSGDAWQTMQAVLDTNLSWRFDPTMPASPALTQDVAAYHQALTGQGEQDLDTARSTLRKRLTLLANAPQTLSPIASQGFYADVLPWLQTGSAWAQAALAALDLQEALRSSDHAQAAAAHARTVEAVAQAELPRVDVVPNTLDDASDTMTVVPDAVVPSVGDGLLRGLVDTAVQEWAGGAWPGLTSGGTPLTPSGASAVVVADSQASPAQDAGAAADSDPLTAWTSAAPPEAGTAVTVDLGQSQAVSAVTIDQGEVTAPGQAPAPGAADGLLGPVTVEVSADGITWVPLGTGPESPVVTLQAQEPVTARYVRLTTTAAPMAARPVRINEVTVTGPAG